MKITVRGSLRETLCRWVGEGVHVCVRRSSSGGKGGRVGRRAVLECGIVVVLDLVGIDLRGARGFIWIRGSKVNGSLVVGMSVAVHDVVGSGVSLVDVGLAGGSGGVRWSPSPAA